MKTMKKHIYLIGFMGTGKSTVSHRLKRLMNVREIDVDAAIVRTNKMSIPEMFEKYGEQYFRDRETEALAAIAKEKPAVVACGGGTVLRPENVGIMKKSGITILLTAKPETVYARVKNGRNRPILNGHMNIPYIEELMEKRRAAYEGACDVMVSTDGKTPEAIAQEIRQIYLSLK